jgi:carboxyl-terminal processing protease
MLALWLLGVAAAAAAPVPRQTPPAAPRKAAALEGEARAFAHNLLQAVFQVSNTYARPVAPADLVYAALAGLYEAARLSVPRDLHERIGKAAGGPQVMLPLELAPNAEMPARQEPALAPLIRKAYVEAAGAESLQGRSALLVALRAMTASLDPHTVVGPAEELRRTTSLNQAFIGFGVEIEDGPAVGQVLLRAVQPGGPAQRAGLRPGDEITRLDGRPVAELGSGMVAARLQMVPAEDLESPPPALDVKLTLWRPGVRGERVVALAAERFQPETVLGVCRRADNSWDYWLDRRRGLAQVRVGPLATGTAAQLQAVLSGLRDEGLRGLVLDLRWCPGGLIKEATECAELFLGEAVIARTKERSQERVFRSTGEPKFQDVPVVVLINGATSGGGELIAAALQDHGRPRVCVAGQRSLGKGSIQTSVFLSGANLGLKVTSGTFLRPSGKNLHRFADSKPQDDWGVRPDAGLEFPMSPALERQLRQWWLWQTLRPGAAREALPLDDPEADPQRQAAAQALQERLDHKGGFTTAAPRAQGRKGAE